MRSSVEIIEELRKYDFEREWFEFKENWFKAEFGNQCLLYSLDEVLRYGDVLNIIQADEKNRVVERKEVP